MFIVLIIFAIIGFLLVSTVGSVFALCWISELACKRKRKRATEVFNKIKYMPLEGFINGSTYLVFVLLEEGEHKFWDIKYERTLVNKSYEAQVIEDIYYLGNGDIVRGFILNLPNRPDFGHKQYLDYGITWKLRLVV